MCSRDSNPLAAVLPGQAKNKQELQLERLPKADLKSACNFPLHKTVWAYDVPPPAAKRTYLEEAGGWRRWNKSSELVPMNPIHVYSCQLEQMQKKTT